MVYSSTVSTWGSHQSWRHGGALLAIIGLQVALLALVSSGIHLTRATDEPQRGVFQTPAPPPRVAELAPAVVVEPPAPPAEVVEVAEHIEERAALPPPSPQARAIVAAKHTRPTARVATQADVTPPTSPREVLVSARSDVTVDVTWGESTDDVGVTGYEVSREDGTPAAVATTSFSESGLTPRGEYCYTVVALDAAGNRSAPSQRACTATLDILPPTIPDHVKVTVVDSSTVLLRWAPSTDDSEARIEYEVLDNGVLVATADRASWKHHVEPRSEHRYTVRAVDYEGNRSLPSQSVFVSLADGAPPSTPRNLTVSPFSSTSLTAQWSSSTDDVAVVGYEVLENDEVVVRSPGTTASLTALGEYEERCLSVRAIDAAGNRSMPTPPVCGRTLPLERTEGDRRVVTFPGVQRRMQQ